MMEIKRSSIVHGIVLQTERDFRFDLQLYQHLKNPHLKSVTQRSLIQVRVTVVVLYKMCVNAARLLHRES